MERAASCPPRPYMPDNRRRTPRPPGGVDSQSGLPSVKADAAIASAACSSVDHRPPRAFRFLHIPATFFPPPFNYR
eukprot:scaffold235666_cov31-Tisochrysis_lutea.AAC.1